MPMIPCQPHLEAIHLYALREKLLHARRAHISQAVVSVVYESLSEGAQPQGDHHAVVQDLGGNVGLANVVLQVAHKEEVARRVKAVVQRVMRDVAEHCAGTASVVPMLVHRHAQDPQLLRIVSLRMEREKAEEEQHGKYEGYRPREREQGYKSCFDPSIARGRDIQQVRFAMDIGATKNSWDGRNMSFGEHPPRSTNQQHVAAALRFTAAREPSVDHANDPVRER